MAAIAAELRNAVAELEGDVKLNIRDGRKTGRTYRRSAIVRKETRSTAGLNLRKRGDRVIVGFNFHRASRRGESPAIDSGRLINSIRGRMVAPLIARLGVGAGYGVVLDDPQGLDRPFFMSRAELYRPRFRERMRRVIFGK